MNNNSNLLQYHDLIASIVEAMEVRDLYTSYHSLRVAEMTESICNYLGLSKSETAIYHISAHLHDLGKLGVQDSVLRKEDKLTNDEWEEMRQHPVIGYNILHKIKSFGEISSIVRAHHERIDGRGYPDGLNGDSIPYGARIIAIADSIDAMLSVRPYRKGMSSQICKNEIELNRGLMYDSSIADIVLENWDNLLKRRQNPNSLRFSLSRS